MRLHSEMEGMYKIEAVKLDADGNEISRRTLADWFPNLITDGGLEYIATNTSWLGYCQVGSGSTAPSVLDTALVSKVAGTNTQQALTAGCQSASPYYTWVRKTFRFAEGVAAGNLSEVGVGWATTGSLFSRALILDAGGSPTTITVLSDETLDVTYEFRYYPKTTDDTGTLTLTGNIGGEYNWTMRASNVTTYDGSGWSVSGRDQEYSFYSYCVAYDGEIGAITGYPSGLQDLSTSVAANAYVASSHQMKFTVTWGLNDGNFVAGIRSIAVRMGFGYFQFRFGKTLDDSPIMKTSSDILALTVYHSWGRRP